MPTHETANQGQDPSQQRPAQDADTGQRLPSNAPPGTIDGQTVGKTDASITLNEPTRQFYCHAMRTLREAGVPYLLGGAYALRQYTGIVRQTKDLDVFVREEHVADALAALARAGYRTEMTDPAWLAKAFSGDAFVDLIFASANGICHVDDAWFTHAIPAEVLGEPVLLMPAEEIIWTKAFIDERERYDGADIAHLLRARAEHLDWNRLLLRFGPYWRPLYAHLVLFGFVYPGERHRLPVTVMRELAERLTAEEAAPALEGQLCQGTLISRVQYLPDVESWGYRDARYTQGLLTPPEIARESHNAEDTSTIPRAS